MSAAYETVLVERDGHVATITLNRPDKLNALNEELLHELARVVRELAQDHDVCAARSSPARARRRSPRAPTSPR